jgi:UDP-N-acetylglucosamine--N-acetylmuramyl-(pentapeptide) pyrophosphoryl-undecaprenol N-acetylglucosamine transferase
VGGGSGGHIAPLLAVAKYLKTHRPELRIVAVTERGGRFSQMFENQPMIDEVRFVNAGKLRRYYGESWTTRLFDVRRNLLNIRDLCRLSLGLLQSLWLLGRLKPDLVFIKGGYVGVPVGFAARFRGVPYITHDSDALPGLANRLIAGHARLNAVGMPEEFYSYPKAKMVRVGIPTDPDAHPLSKEERQAILLAEKLPTDARVLLITGGSNGAQRVDEAIHTILQDLLQNNLKLRVIHLVGQGNEQLYDDYEADLQSRIRVARFLQPLSRYSGVADVIVTRAGASTLAEFAAQAKPCIVIPNPLLTGGHQTKNAAVLEKSHAAIIVSEQVVKDNVQVLQAHITALLDDQAQRHELGEALHKLIPNEGTTVLGDLLLKLLEENRKET